MNSLTQLFGTKNKAIAILFVCSLFLAYKYIAQLFPSAISESLIAHYKMTGIDIAIMASSYYYAYSPLQLVAGYTVDKMDVKWPCSLAILAIATGIAIFAYTDSFSVMCISRALMGIGAAFATVVYIKCAASWVNPKIFGMIVSLLATFVMIGAAISSTPIAYLFDKVGSWHKGLYLLSIAGFIITILALLVVTNKGAPNSISTNTNPPSFKNFKSVVVSKANLLLFVYAGITFAPIIVLGGLWGNPFLIEKFAISNVEASNLLCAMFLGVAAGAPFWAIVTTKNPIKSMHMANLMAFLSALAIIYYASSYLFGLLLCFMLGFAVGCFMTCFQLCYQVNSLTTLGFAVAFINMSDGIASSIVELFIGKTLDWCKTNPSIMKIAANILPSHSHTIIHAHNHLVQNGFFSLASYDIALSLIPACFIISSIALYSFNNHYTKTI